MNLTLESLAKINAMIIKHWPEGTPDRLYYYGENNGIQTWCLGAMMTPVHVRYVLSRLEGLGENIVFAKNEITCRPQS